MNVQCISRFLLLKILGLISKNEVYMFPFKLFSWSYIPSVALELIPLRKKLASRFCHVSNMEKVTHSVLNRMIFEKSVCLQNPNCTSSTSSVHFNSESSLIRFLHYQPPDTVLHKILNYMVYKTISIVFKCIVWCAIIISVNYF